MTAMVAPASFAWLVRHEIRLAWRNRRTKSRTRIVGYLFLAGYLAFGCWMAWLLRHVPFTWNSWVGVGALAGSILLFSFMTTQAMLGSQQTLYESRDLDLLLTAPIAPRTAMLAKLAAIVGVIVLTYLVLLAPMLVPFAVLGHPQILGTLGVIAALAFTAAAVGITLTLVLARLAGPRAARTLGQIAAALLGGAVFIGSQLLSHGDRSRSSVMILFEKFRAQGLGESGLSGMPGHAVFGDPLSLAAMLGLGVALFAATGVLLQRRFLASYQDAGMPLARRTRGKSAPAARLFHAGLFSSIFAKEWRLLARDPALAFAIVLRLVYMAPILYGFSHGGRSMIAPALGFTSVLIATQLTGSFAWLAVSGEDAPDLITVAPIAKAEIDIAKLMAALAMAAPIGVIMPVVIAWHSIPAAIVTLIMTAIGGGLAGLVELKLGKPGQRAAFAKRRQGSVIASLVSLLIAVVFGGISAIAIYSLTAGFI